MSKTWRMDAKCMKDIAMLKWRPGQILRNRSFNTYVRISHVGVDTCLRPKTKTKSDGLLGRFPSQKRSGLKVSGPG